jgi:hypothetical protein
MGLSERKRKSLLRTLKGSGATKTQKETISDARSKKVRE